MKIDAPEDGVLLFRDGYNTGWKAIIDGKKQDVMQANYNQKAVFIEKGTHQELVDENGHYSEMYKLYFETQSAKYLEKIKEN